MRAPLVPWLLLLVLLAMVSRSPTLASESVPFPDTFDVNALDRYLAARVRGPDGVGLSVAVMRRGELVLARGYGRASLTSDRRVTPDTRFAIGSVTKQFTCACVLLLAEDGRLSVHDPVSKFYPELTRAADITLLDLMQHVSGYPDYYPLDFVDRRMQQPIAPDELLRKYAGAKLDFEPRTRWSYSNTGYVLLGRIVEKVSGESFGPFLESRVLRPLGMTNTRYLPATPGDSSAAGYTRFALGDPEPVAPEAAGWIEAAGGIHSTPRDLVQWDLALVEGRILKEDSYATMTTPAVLKDRKVADYGCGLSIRNEGGRQVLSHNGAVSGFNAWNGVIPSTRSAVAVVCNLEGGLGDTPARILSLLLKDPSRLPKVEGAPAALAVRAVFARLQAGNVDRAMLSADFNAYLTEERLAGAAARLQPFGAPRQVDVIESHERGGMEVTSTRLEFGNANLRVLMYRTPDGTIQQFFIYPLP